MTVAQLVAQLLKQPQDLPVLVGCHYDNDNALTDQVYVATSVVVQSEGEFHLEVDNSYPGAFTAVTVS